MVSVVLTSRGVMNGKESMAAVLGSAQPLDSVLCNRLHEEGKPGPDSFVVIIVACEVQLRRCLLQC